MKKQHPGKGRPVIEELEPRWVPSTYSTSSNWAGYAVQTGKNAVTSVTGSWVVPTATGTGNSYSSAWVGIDGWTSNTVEQIGTDSDIENGHPVYYAWYEMYPADAVNVTKLAIHPGDTITASVTFTSAGFVLSLTDNKSGTFTTTQHLPGGKVAARSSAEWIQEAPSNYDGSLAKLSNFGTIGFSNASTTVNGKTLPISAFGSATQQVDMTYNSGAIEAKTSGLNATGNGFTVSYVAPPSGGGGGHHHSWWWWRDPAQSATPSTNTDLQSASLQNGLQNGQARQASFNSTPSASSTPQQQIDVALWSRVTVPPGRVSLDSTSLLGAGQERQSGDGWFAPDEAPPAEFQADAGPVVE